MEDKKPKQDISDLLRQADEENERARSKRQEHRVTGIPPEKTQTVPAVPPKDGADAKTAEVPEGAHGGSSRFDAETVELINKYSTRELHEEKSDTKELRDTLARKLQDDKLRGYLDTSSGSSAKKAEHLRSLIRDTESVGAAEPEKHVRRDVSGRFSEEETIPEQPEFEQAEMFQLGDGMTLKEQAEEKGAASYDKDYESLGQKVVESGIPGDEDDGQIAFIPDETEVAPLNRESDETMVNLRVAFDMMQEGDEEKEDGGAEKLLRRRRKHPKKEVLLRYTDRTQNREFSGKLRAEKRRSLLRLVLVAIVMIVLGRMEFGGAFYALTEQGDAGLRVYLLLDLQLVLLCGLITLPSVCRGLKGIVTGKLTSDSLLAAGLAIDTLYTLFQLIFLPQADSPGLYGFAAALSALCAAAAACLNAGRNCRSFRMASTRKPKYVAQQLEDTRRESEEFGRFLYDGSELYTVKRAEFVEDFSERVTARSRFEDLFRFLLPTILLCGALLTAAMLFLGNGIKDSVRAGFALWAVSLPTTSFFLMPLPLAWANRRGKKFSAAYIGNGAADEYAMASVLTFADTEVYPSNLVDVTSFKTYGDYGIDRAITDAAKVFGYLGGPLSKVLRHMVDGPCPEPESIRIIENVADGICVAMDGKHYYLGKRGYMRRYRFESPVDQGDDGYEKGVGSVMYMVIDEKLVAKFYIRYRVNPRFEMLLRELHRAGICLGIKTMDPNIVTDMVVNGIRFRKCPVAVLKQNDPAEVVSGCGRASSGIVCNSSLHNFLQMFAMCGKVRHAIRCNAVVTLVSVFLAFLAVIFLSVTGDLSAFGAAQAVIFQLCCQVPVWALSLLMI